MDLMDIYDDLDEFHEQEKKKSNELLELEVKYNEALRTIEAMNLEKKDLRKKIRIMQQNFQSLLDTAKAEIKRKDKLIEQLRKEKDDICFRRQKVQITKVENVERTVVATEICSLNADGAQTSESQRGKNAFTAELVNPFRKEIAEFKANEPTVEQDVSKHLDFSKYTIPKISKSKHESEENLKTDDFDYQKRLMTDDRSKTLKQHLRRSRSHERTQIKYHKEKSIDHRTKYDESAYAGNNKGNHNTIKRRHEWSNNEYNRERSKDNREYNSRYHEREHYERISRYDDSFQNQSRYSGKHGSKSDLIRRNSRSSDDEYGRHDSKRRKIESNIFKDHQKRDCRNNSTDSKYAERQRSPSHNREKSRGSYNKEKRKDDESYLKKHSDRNDEKWESKNNKHYSKSRERTFENDREKRKKSYDSSGSLKDESRNRKQRQSSDNRDCHQHDFKSKEKTKENKQDQSLDFANDFVNISSEEDDGEYNSDERTNEKSLEEYKNTTDKNILKEKEVPIKTQNIINSAQHATIDSTETDSCCFTEEKILEEKQKNENLDSKPTFSSLDALKIIDLFDALFGESPARAYDQTSGGCEISLNAEEILERCSGNSVTTSSDAYTDLSEFSTIDSSKNVNEVDNTDGSSVKSTHSEPIRKRNFLPFGSKIEKIPGLGDTEHLKLLNSSLKKVVYSPNEINDKESISSNATSHDVDLKIIESPQNFLTISSDEEKKKSNKSKEATNKFDKSYSTLITKPKIDKVFNSCYVDKYNQTKNRMNEMDYESSVDISRTKVIEEKDDKALNKLATTESGNDLNLAKIKECIISNDVENNTESKLNNVTPINEQNHLKSTLNKTNIITKEVDKILANTSETDCVESSKEGIPTIKELTVLNKPKDSATSNKKEFEILKTVKNYNEISVNNDPTILMTSELSLVSDTTALHKQSVIKSIVLANNIPLNQPDVTVNDNIVTLDKQVNVVKADSALDDNVEVLKLPKTDTIIEVKTPKKIVPNLEKSNSINKDESMNITKTSQIDEKEDSTLICKVVASNKAKSPKDERFCGQNCDITVLDSLKHNDDVSTTSLTKECVNIVTNDKEKLRKCNNSKVLKENKSVTDKEISNKCNNSKMLSEIKSVPTNVITVHNEESYKIHSTNNDIENTKLMLNDKIVSINDVNNKIESVKNTVTALDCSTSTLSSNITVSNNTQTELNKESSGPIDNLDNMEKATDIDINIINRAVMPSNQTELQENYNLTISDKINKTESTGIINERLLNTIEPVETVKNDNITSTDKTVSAVISTIPNLNNSKMSPTSVNKISNKSKGSILEEDVTISKKTKTKKSKTHSQETKILNNAKHNNIIKTDNTIERLQVESKALLNEEINIPADIVNNFKTESESQNKSNFESNYISCLDLTLSSSDNDSLSDNIPLSQLQRKEKIEIIENIRLPPLFKSAKSEDCVTKPKSKSPLKAFSKSTTVMASPKIDLIKPYSKFQDTIDINIENCDSGIVDEINLPKKMIVAQNNSPDEIENYNNIEEDKTNYSSCTTTHLTKANVKMKLRGKQSDNIKSKTKTRKLTKSPKQNIETTSSSLKKPSAKIKIKQIESKVQRKSVGKKAKVQPKPLENKNSTTSELNTSDDVKAMLTHTSTSPMLLNEMVLKSPAQNNRKLDDIEKNMQAIFQSPLKTNESISHVCQPGVSPNKADSSSHNSSFETKRLSLGSSQYLVECDAENVATIFITRKKRQKPVDN